MWGNEHPSRLVSPMRWSLLGEGQLLVVYDLFMSFLCPLLPQSSSFRRNFSSPLLVHEPPPACATSRESPPTGECSPATVAPNPTVVQ